MSEDADRRPLIRVGGLVARSNPNVLANQKKNKMPASTKSATVTWIDYPWSTKYELMYDVNQRGSMPSLQGVGDNHVFRQEEMDKFSNKIPHLGGEFFRSRFRDVKKLQQRTPRGILLGLLNTGC